MLRLRQGASAFFETILPVAAGLALQKVTNAEQIGPASAMALLVIVTIVPLAILILRDGRAA